MNSRMSGAGKGKLREILEQDDEIGYVCGFFGFSKNRGGFHLWHAVVTEK